MGGGEVRAPKTIKIRTTSTPAYEEKTVGKPFLMALMWFFFPKPKPLILTAMGPSFG
ncbi:MAG: hypothetical protein H0A76_05670 [Candidatus Thiodubiliella endoseptemdiera]|uniref:Uncharacterized protein n=1 Tax=Candidatus Thiodubiliella endoseptemdiera TaxID=2738886 RepID=A0A853F1I5_9GAMM|nr:hypothetical protein [Candidatus Thiodubiliella endoseptemdiera]